MVKSKRMRWAGDVAQMGGRSGSNRVLGGGVTGRKETILGVDYRILLK